MEFTQLDVFAESTYEGNALAVFHDAAELGSGQMQRIAREMNLSETTFVTAARADSYEVRIFTPTTELPFAGHPTIGTAWTLLQKGMVEGPEITQHSQVGETPVRVEGEVVWIERPGSAEPDLEDRDPTLDRAIADALGLTERDVGLEAREFGRAGRLRPAFATVGVRQLMVPVKNEEVLGRCRVPSAPEIVGVGAYCFCAGGAGRILARGFWPGLGIPEDPATGSAALGLGIYLADRVGDIDMEVVQGTHVRRPSRIHLRAHAGRASIGGRCQPVFEGRLVSLP